MSTYAVEITVAVDAAGTLRTLWLSSGALVTGPADTPAHTAFAARIEQPANYREDLFAPGATGGASQVSRGELVLLNTDGALDAWIGYGWSGRPLVVRVGQPGNAYPTRWSPVLRGTVEQALFDDQRVVIRIRDRQAELDVPASPATYAGSNVLPDGLEGVAEDLKDQRKPRAFGRVLNIAPPLVNSARLIYQVNSGAVQSVDAVYDKGAPLTAGAVYASQADMEAAAPAPGEYRVWSAGGCLRLGSTPVGQLTADVTADTAAASRAGSLLRSLARTAGVADTDIRAADVTALDAAAPYTLGLWLPAGDSSTCRAAMDRIAASVGAFYSFDNMGLLRMGVLTDPAGAALALDIKPWQVLQLARAPLRDVGAGVPAWRTTVRYGRNWTVQASDLAGSVGAERRAWLQSETRAALAQDAAVTVQHLLATDMAVDTLIDARADAQAEAARLLALFKVQRHRFECAIAAEASALAALTPGCAVRVTWPRYGLSAGRTLVVLGLRLDLAAGRAELTLWG